MSPVDIYQPPRFDAEIDLDLSRNEGRPWPLSDTALAIDLDVVSRYPDTTRLQTAVAVRHGIETDRVLITAGGDDALARCFLSRAGTTVVATTPSFEMITRYARQTGGSVVQVEWWDDDFPLGEFLDLAEGASMAVIVSPNNPTGNVIGEADLREVAEAFPLVVLDAAYADFTDGDLTDAALACSNVVTVRTFSKAYGLAGLRAGYLLGARDVVAEISAYGSPYPVSGLSASLAEEALGADEDERSLYLAEISDERRALADVLDEVGARPLRSRANFVLASDVDADWVISAAASLGIGLRGFPGRPELARCVRITVPGERRDFDRLVAVLRTILAPEALILDLDGVVADVSRSYTAAVIGTANSFGVTVSSEDIAEAKTSGGANDDWELTRSLCLAAGVDIAIDDVVSRFQLLYEGSGSADGLRRTERPLLPPETLERWAKRIPLALVTGRPRKEAEEFLARFGLGDVFGALVTRDDASLKPDPAPVRLAMERLGVSHVWMVGDTHDDITAARAAGAVPIGVVAPGDPPLVARKGLNGAALILDSIDQLEEVLDDRNV
ncbi:MAG: aminotransferase class I/II-fold pyridoxal phosphate-dependent enzyme [Acidimicrobiia bacterium]|jgi:HAD superfamily hydrolase (TIGR01548 family)